MAYIPKPQHQKKDLNEPSDCWLEADNHSKLYIFRDPLVVISSGTWSEGWAGWLRYLICSFRNSSSSLLVFLHLSLAVSCCCWCSASRERTDWRSHMAGNKPRAGFMSTLCRGSGFLPPHLIWLGTLAKHGDQSSALLSVTDAARSPAQWREQEWMSSLHQVRSDTDLRQTDNRCSSVITQHSSV